jgi:GH24 family phage-related lysozyme (muramidase)
MAAKMKIEILKRTVCDGEPVAPGDVVSASEKDAKFLINTEKAKATTRRVGKAKADEKQKEEDEPAGD